MSLQNITLAALATSGQLTATIASCVGAAANVSHVSASVTEVVLTCGMSLRTPQLTPVMRAAIASGVAASLSVSASQVAVGSSAAGGRRRAARQLSQSTGAVTSALVTVGGLTPTSAGAAASGVTAAVASSSGPLAAALRSVGIAAVTLLAPPTLSATVTCILGLTARDPAPGAVSASVQGLIASGSPALSRALVAYGLPASAVTPWVDLSALSGPPPPPPPIPPLPPLPPIALSGCASAPCFPGVVCQQLAGAAASLSGATFQCGPCPAGYTGNGVTCTSVNYCAARVCDALTVCTSTPGSFTCSALPSARPCSKLRGAAERIPLICTIPHATPQVLARQATVGADRPAARRLQAAPPTTGAATAWSAAATLRLQVASLFAALALWGILGQATRPALTSTAAAPP